MKNLDSVAQASVYNDLNGLNSLKQKARSDEDGALHDVARQFESMFVGMVLKSMREANDVMFEDNLLNTYESKFYRQMYDDQLTLSLTTDNRGMGLADVLYRQLKGDLPGEQVVPAEIMTSPKLMEDMMRPVMPKAYYNGKDSSLLNVISGSVPDDSSEELPQDIKDLLHVQNKMTTPITGISYADLKQPDQFNTPEEFVGYLLPIAEKVGRKAGIDGRALIAQAALETGWGQHVMRDDNGNNSHNLFGIKALRDWNGDTATNATQEFTGEQFVTIKDQFRSYDSYQESFEDYLRFLQSHPRYEQALRQGRDGDVFAQKLQDAGYATDPEYAQKIQQIIRSSWVAGAPVTPTEVLS